MQEIHAHQTAEERVVKCVPAGSAIHQFENEAHRAQHKARQERRDRPLGIEPGPEDSQNKAGRDWRADVALHALQVNIKLTANQMDERHPGQSQNYHEAGHHPAETHELQLGGIRLDLLIEIQRN